MSVTAMLMAWDSAPSYSIAEHTSNMDDSLLRMHNARRAHPLMCKCAVLMGLLLAALCLWPATSLQSTMNYFGEVQILPRTWTPIPHVLQTARPLSTLQQQEILHSTHTQQAVNGPSRDALTATAADVPGRPRSPWHRLVTFMSSGLSAALTLIRSPGRALSATGRGLVAMFRGIAAFAKRRPVTFVVLLLEALFCFYVAGTLIYRLALKGLGVSVAQTGLVAGAALSSRPLEVAYSSFLQHVDLGLATDVLLSGGKVQYVVDVAQAKALAAAAGGTTLASAAALPGAKEAANVLSSVVAGSEGTQRVFAYSVAATGGLVENLVSQGVGFRAARPEMWSGIISKLFFVAYFVFLIGLFRRMFTDNGAAKMTGKDATHVTETFDDVAGLTEAKANVVEVVNILRDPAKYQAMGARMPSGLLLVGPPGGGKTLLARCLAGEAGVPFFACSGSDFIEVFAGRGASRVRALFKKAAAVAPCVIFIDELDALGKKRSMRFNTSSEDDQTLNQLLAAMDGFDTSNNGVVVVAATNRYNLLDEALIRPGRFDRVVRVDLPTAEDREAILDVHLRNKNVDTSLEAPGALKRLADLTPNFSGAELAALTNEAAIRAVRRQGTAMSIADMEQAILSYRASRSPAGGLFGDLIR
uniref:AAA+ ATPase domain-containing protein n=1 Tax=Eutreptiella gymnastica TaxID=73025 RepID=A0A7S4GLH8_9EUGL